MEAFEQYGGEEKKNIKNFEEILKRGESEFFELSTYEFLIEHFSEIGEFDKALRACELGIEQHPYSTELKVEIARVLFQKGDVQGALTAIEEAEMYQPNDEELIILKANIFYQQEKYEESIELFESIRPIGEDADMMFFTIGMAYQNIGNMEKAIENFKKTLESNIENEDALLELTSC